jgi:hypothetical protein
MKPLVPILDKGLFHLSAIKSETIMKFTVSPTGQWSGSKAQSALPAYRQNTSRTSLPDTKQTLLPRSLDVSFTLRYRR